MSSLDDYRREIDEIDEMLVKLFEKRMEIVEKVAIYKKENKLPIFNSSREKEVIKKALEILKDSRYNVQTELYIKKIMEISKHLQFDIMK